MSVLFIDTTNLISVGALWGMFQTPCRVCTVATEEQADCLQPRMLHFDSKSNQHGLLQT